MSKKKELGEAAQSGPQNHRDSPEPLGSPGQLDGETRQPQGSAVQDADDL